MSEQEAEEEQKERKQDADYEPDVGELGDVGDSKGTKVNWTAPREEEKPDQLLCPKY